MVKDPVCGTEIEEGKAHADAEGLLQSLRIAAWLPKEGPIVDRNPGPAAELAGRVRGELGWEATVRAYGDRAAIA